jgi:hypothetical protein
MRGKMRVHGLLNGVDLNILDIDFLKLSAAKYESKPYWFGLGFMQLKINDWERLHFWFPDLFPIERDEVHNHRYTFYSQVLDGILHHETYAVTLDANGDHELFETDCAPGKEGSHPQHLLPCFLTNTAKYTLTAGASYLFDHETFHTTANTRSAVTYLQREERAKDSALVVKRRGVETICPFKCAEIVTEKECWERIEAALIPIKERMNGQTI